MIMFTFSGNRELRIDRSGGVDPVKLLLLTMTVALYLPVTEGNLSLRLQETLLSK